MSSQHWPTTTDIGYPSWPRPNGVPGVTEAMLRRCSGYGPDRPPLARKQSGLRHRCHPIDRPLPPACYMAVLLVLQHVSDAGLARARPGPVALKDVEQRVPRPGRSAADYPAAASFVCQHPGPGRHVALSATPRRLVRGGLLRHLARRRRRATQHGPAGHGTRTGIDNAGPLHPSTPAAPTTPTASCVRSPTRTTAPCTGDLITLLRPRSGCTPDQGRKSQRKAHPSP